MQVSLQEKNNLYFSILKIMESFPDKKEQAKEITLFISDFLKEKELNITCGDIMPIEEHQKCKKGVFRRVP